METTEMIQFLKLVQQTIQTNYPSNKECQTAMESLLNRTDELHISLTGHAIVKRGSRNLLDVLVSQPLSRIKL